MVKKNWLYTTSTWVISLFLANGGFMFLKDYPEFWPAGISLILTAFVMVYFSSYISQINENKESLERIKKEMERINSEIDLYGKLLNTIKDIVLLKKR